MFYADRWQRAIEEFSKLRAHWDATKQCYVFANGSTLPEPESVLYRRSIWKVPALGSDAQISFERINPRWASATLYKSAIGDTSFPKSRIRFFEPGGNSGTLTEFHVEEGEHGITSATLLLDAGKSVQATLFLGSKRLDSPVFTP